MLHEKITDTQPKHRVVQNHTVLQDVELVSYSDGCAHYRLEEIAAAASKEYLLEKNLKKMKSEWSDMCFEFVQYRDSVSSHLTVTFHCRHRRLGMRGMHPLSISPRGILNT